MGFRSLWLDDTVLLHSCSLPHFDRQDRRRTILGRRRRSHDSLQSQPHRSLAMDHQVHNYVSLLSLDNQSKVSWSILSLNIESDEKIGIVGRTGAAKSSFIPTLFRMATLGLDHSTRSGALHRHDKKQSRSVRWLFWCRDLADTRTSTIEETGQWSVESRTTVDSEWIECGSEAVGVSGASDTKEEQDSCHRWSHS